MEENGRFGNKTDLLDEIINHTGDLSLENQVMVLILAKAMRDAHGCMRVKSTDPYALTAKLDDKGAEETDRISVGR